MNRPARFAAFAAAVLLFSFAGAAGAAGPIVSGEVKTGTISGPTFAETWTFSGVAGQRIVLAALTTSGSLNTNMALQGPGGGAAVVNTSVDRTDYQLLATGTYTLTISDYSLAQAGTYSLSFLNVTGGPLTTAGDLDGGPIVSAEIKAGQIGSVTDFDAFTFTGAVGQRVIITALATSGPFNTAFYLYPPDGGPAENSTTGDRLEHQLLQSGTYTIVIEDYGNDQTGGYNLSLLNLTAGPLTAGADPDGGILVSGESVSGQINAAGDMDAWRFVGTFGQRIVIAGVATSIGINTNIAVYPPSGAPVVFTSADRNDFQLTASGTYTIVLEDYGDDTPGTYTLSLMNVSAGPYTSDADLDAGTINSGGYRTGQISAPADFDVYTFDGVAGDRVLIAALATGGALNTTFYLYPPSGGPAEDATTADRIDHQLVETGTYKILIEDNGNDDTGTYKLSLIDLASGSLTGEGDPDGGNIGSAEIRTGQINTIGDFDAYRFSGNVGDHIVIGALATGGALNTNVAVYPPVGAAVVFTSADRIEYQLTSAGTHTIVIEDLGDDTPGTYSLSYVNITAGPFTQGADTDGGPIVSAGNTTGQIGAAVDFDTYTFTGTAGDRVLLSCLATGGAINTTFYLYPPGGGAVEDATTADRIDHQLAVSGTYTLLVEDNNLDNTGSYILSMINLTSGPLTSAGDLNGGPITSGEIYPGQINTTGDFDAYRFNGSFGQHIVVGALTTAGTLNTNIAIYPPSGVAVVFTSADRIDYQLQATGTFTIVIEDLGDDDSGSYTLGYMNTSVGPYATATDLDGGPIASTEIKTGQISAPVDFDVYTFNGTAGDRVLIGALATSGTLNTTYYLYPPAGGASENSTAGDRLDHQLLATGKYTILIEDQGLDNTGGYSLIYQNVSSGPLKSVTDTDGGPLARGQLASGQISPVTDIDVWEFNGAVGDTAVITCATTSGLMNTNIAIYPPGGGVAVVYTSADLVTYVLTQSGYYGLEVEDLGLDQTGSYQIQVKGSGGVVGVVPGSDAIPLNVLLAAPAPNPFGQSTTIGFALPAPGSVQLRIFDVRGAAVRTLAAGDFTAGSHRVTWDGRDDNGGAAASGVYYMELRTGGKSLERRIVLLR